MTEASTEMQKYFSEITNSVKELYAICNLARSKGYDPEIKVDIPLARNMAERVEGLISAVAPQLVGKGMPARIEELEKEYSPTDWRVGLRIAEEVAKEKFCKFNNVREAMELGIRVGFSYLTGGIVSAPLEGFIELKIKKRRDGKDYVAPCYAGPIRGAGGTAASASVILVDYVRTKMGYDTYDISEEEIERLVTEVTDYHTRCTNLQYFPSTDELKFILKNLPVEISGDPTEKFEVSNHKDMPRIETNVIRGGVCLVLAEGLSQKASKLWKQLSAWGKEMGLNWGFLEEFLKLQKKVKSGASSDSKEKLSPNYTFIKDLVAGRPILTYPMRNGGFRLRYGRTRITGFSAAGINPATMRVLDNYVATGTQLKVERPGKAAAITPCDTIDGPIVKLEDGSVVYLGTEADYFLHKDNIKEIIYLGDMLFCYGDFFENGHILVPAGYCEEWWEAEVKLKDPKFDFSNMDFKSAIEVSSKFGVPLYPKFIFYWSTLKKEEFIKLVQWFLKARIEKKDGVVKKIILPVHESKRYLELIGCVHKFVNNLYIVIEGDLAAALHLQLKLDEDQIEYMEKIEKYISEFDVLGVINKLSPYLIRDKCGTFIGARMGRPEKAKMRKLTGSPHGLFPVGEEGGRLRSFQAVFEVGKVTADFPIYKCLKCDKYTVFSVCENCEVITSRIYNCKVCGAVDSEECKLHGPAAGFVRRPIDLRYYFDSILKKLGDPTFPDLIKGVKGTSNRDHTPEHLLKAILRAKHNIFVNKDGTTRYDMSELPITHFLPSEIGVSVEKLIEMGYTSDINNEPLTNDLQVLELKPQDIILPAGEDSIEESSDEVLFRVGNFVDELLQKMYGAKSYYNFKSKRDVVGHLVIGLAPHISAGMIGRVIGFSKTQGCFSHPLWHAALRRDCDGDECCVILLGDALLNFSRNFLPDRRGSRTMDSPLVLSSVLIPSEVDSQALGVDIGWSYPVELYEAALQYKSTRDIKIEKIGDNLGTFKQYEKMGYTHNVSNMNVGVKFSAYKSLPSMEEKLKGQMEIAERIRAVDEANVATLVIEKHFIRDIKGNLRKFSTQQFRCVKCSEKYRRPPLKGVCFVCGGKLLFTISEGSVVKYLEPTLSLAKKYDVPIYLKQTLTLLHNAINDVFGKAKEKQTGLGSWFG